MRANLWFQSRSNNRFNNGVRAFSSMVARTMPSAMDNVSFQYVIFIFFSKNVRRAVTGIPLQSSTLIGVPGNVTDDPTMD